MSAEMCTSEQAITALGYFNNSFGGYPMTPDEQRPYLRLFLGFAPAEVQAAIDKLARGWTAARRPMPNDVAQVIQASKPKVRASEGPYLAEVEFEPPPDLSDRIASLRELAKGAGR
jgi:hypothetical protein